MRDITVGKIHGHSREVSSAALPRVSTGYSLRALVDKSGMIRTQMVKHNRSVSNGRSVCDALCDTTP
jgi:hypothetical protein